MENRVPIIALGIVAFVTTFFSGAILGKTMCEPCEPEVKEVYREVVVVERDNEMACVFAYLSQTMAEALLEEWGHYDELVEAKSLAITYQIGNDCESYIDGL